MFKYVTETWNKEASPGGEAGFCERIEAKDSPLTFKGYVKDSYLLNVSTPRFGTGEAKCALKESVRGCDLYIIDDVTNYSVEFNFFHYEECFLKVATNRQRTVVTKQECVVVLKTGIKRIGNFHRGRGTVNAGRYCADRQHCFGK